MDWNRMKECIKCLNVAGYDTFLQETINISNDGICSQCVQWNNTLKDFLYQRKTAKAQLRRIFYQIKREKHEYDALLSLSGGKDSSTALILAKEKYKLNILAFTTDKGNFYNGIREKIIGLTDSLGVDHVFIKTPKNLMARLYRFGLKTLSTGGIQCKICGGLVHIPILSRFLLNYDIPALITGLDLWEIQAGYNNNFKKEKHLQNPFLYTFPTLKNRWNNYQMTINDCLHLLQRFSREDEFPKLAKKLKRITVELIRRYGLNSEELREFNRLEFFDIALTALEISSREKQLKLLKLYGWSPPQDIYTGEIVGTDCKIGGVINAITTYQQKRKMWSYRIRSGIITKNAAIEEILKEQPKISRICSTIKEIGLKKLENVLISGWNNCVYGPLYDINLINKINSALLT